MEQQCKEIEEFENKYDNYYYMNRKITDVKGVGIKNQNGLI